MIQQMGAAPRLAVVPERGRSDGDWKALYRVGGAAAALLALLTVAHAGVFFAVGLPASAVEWFALFRRGAVLGLLAFELLMVVYALVSVPLALALFVVLRRSSPALAALYLASSLVGSVAFVLARPGFEMLALSAGYAAAATDAQRLAYVAAGEATLAAFRGTAFWVSYAMGSLGGLVLAAAMLRGAVFGRGTACLRIASSVLDWGLLLPGVGLFLSLLSVLCLLAFNLLVARRFLRLGEHRVDGGAIE